MGCKPSGKILPNIDNDKLEEPIQLYPCFVKTPRKEQPKIENQTNNQEIVQSTQLNTKFDECLPKIAGNDEISKKDYGKSLQNDRLLNSNMSFQETNQLIQIKNSNPFYIQNYNSLDNNGLQELICTTTKNNQEDVGMINEYAERKIESISSEEHNIWIQNPESPPFIHQKNNKKSRFCSLALGNFYEGTQKSDSKKPVQFSNEKSKNQKKTQKSKKSAGKPQHHSHTPNKIKFLDKCVCGNITCQNGNSLPEKLQFQMKLKTFAEDLLRSHAIITDQSKNCQFGGNFETSHKAHTYNINNNLMEYADVENNQTHTKKVKEDTKGLLFNNEYSENMNKFKTISQISEKNPIEPEKSRISDIHETCNNNPNLINQPQDSIPKTSPENPYDPKHTFKFSKLIEAPTNHLNVQRQVCQPSGSTVHTKIISNISKTSLFTKKDSGRGQYKHATSNSNNYGYKIQITHDDLPNIVSNYKTQFTYDGDPNECEAIRMDLEKNLVESDIIENRQIQSQGNLDSIDCTSQLQEGIITSLNRDKTESNYLTGDGKAYQCSTDIVRKIKSHSNIDENMDHLGLENFDNKKMLDKSTPSGYSNITVPSLTKILTKDNQSLKNPEMNSIDVLSVNLKKSHDFSEKDIGLKKSCDFSNDRTNGKKSCKKDDPNMHHSDNEKFESNLYRQVQDHIGEVRVISDFGTTKAKIQDNSNSLNVFNNNELNSSNYNNQSTGQINYRKSQRATDFFLKKQLNQAIHDKLILKKGSKFDSVHIDNFGKKIDSNMQSDPLETPKSKCFSPHSNFFNTNSQLAQIDEKHISEISNPIISFNQKSKNEFKSSRNIEQQQPPTNQTDIPSSKNIDQKKANKPKIPKAKDRTRNAMDNRKKNILSECQKNYPNINLNKNRKSQVVPHRKNSEASIDLYKYNDFDDKSNSLKKIKVISRPQSPSNYNTNTFSLDKQPSRPSSATKQEKLKKSSFKNDTDILNLQMGAKDNTTQKKIKNQKSKKVITHTPEKSCSNSSVKKETAMSNGTKNTLQNIRDLDIVQKPKIENFKIHNQNPGNYDKRFSLAHSKSNQVVEFSCYDSIPINSRRSRSERNLDLQSCDSDRKLISGNHNNLAMTQMSVDGSGVHISADGSGRYVPYQSPLGMQNEQVPSMQSEQVKYTPVKNSFFSTKIKLKALQATTTNIRKSQLRDGRDKDLQDVLGDHEVKFIPGRKSKIFTEGMGISLANTPSNLNNANAKSDIISIRKSIIPIAANTDKNQYLNLVPQYKSEKMQFCSDKISLLNNYVNNGVKLDEGPLCQSVPPMNFTNENLENDKKVVSDLNNKSDRKIGLKEDLGKNQDRRDSCDMIEGILQNELSIPDGYSFFDNKLGWMGPILIPVMKISLM